MFCLKFMPWSLYMIQCLQILYLVYISCISIYPAWYLVKFSYKNYSENFQSPKMPLYFLFQAEPADRTGRPDPVSGRARLCTSDGRPTGRPAENRLLTVFCRSAERSTDQKFLLSVFCRTADRSTRAQRLYASRADGRPGRSTAKPARAPTALSSLVIFWKTVFRTFWVADFLDLLGTYFGPYELN